MAQRFLRDTDYNDQIRAELRQMLNGDADCPKLRQAEQKAIAQMKMYLTSRYDTERIFAVPPDDQEDTRDAFVVMTLIDLVLYHLWSKERGKMPQVRNDRYQDALDWLKSVGRGEDICNLPSRAQEDVSGGVQIYSIHAPNDNKY